MQDRYLVRATFGQRRVAASKAALARDMRLFPTPPEDALWQELVGSRSWRRQVVLFGYIIDFYNPGARLAVEVDGEYHLSRTEYDASRTAHLAKRSIMTLRFTNAEVLSNPALVADKIKVTAASRPRFRVQVHSKPPRRASSPKPHNRQYGFTLEDVLRDIAEKERY